MRTILVVLLGVAVATPGFAQKNTQGEKTYALSDLVELSLGYVQLRPKRVDDRNGIGWSVFLPDQPL